MLYRTLNASAASVTLSEFRYRLWYVRLSPALQEYPANRILMAGAYTYVSHMVPYSQPEAACRTVRTAPSLQSILVDRPMARKLLHLLVCR